MNKYQFMKNQGSITRFKILETGIHLWEKSEDVTASSIAELLGITHATVLYHFKNVKEAVAFYAVKIGNSRIIAELIMQNHRAVKDLTKEEKIKHLTNLFKI